MGPIKGIKFNDIEGYCENCIEVHVGLTYKCLCN